MKVNRLLGTLAALAVLASWPAVAQVGPGNPGYAPFTATGNGATNAASSAERAGASFDVVADGNASCNGSAVNGTSIFTPLLTFSNIPQFQTPLTNYCNTTIAQTAFPNMFNLFGSGRVMDSAGNLRGPIYTTISTQPAHLGNYGTSQQTEFNADYSHVPFAIEANVIGTALGSINSSYTLGRQTASMLIRSYQSAGWDSSLDGTGTGRSGQPSILVDFLNASPGGDMSPYWFEGTVSGTQVGAKTFAVNAAVSGPAGQLDAAANGTYMEPFGDLDCVSGVYDAACMSVINMKRDNSAGNLNTNWLGVNLQSTGATPVDAFLRGKGPTTVGIDLTAATFPDASVSSAPPIVAGGSGYATGDLVSMTGGTCDQTPTFIVKTLSTTAIATLGIERKGMCSVWPSNPATLTTVTGAGSGATATITNTNSVNPGIAMTSNTMIYGNAFQDATAWTSGFPSTTWLGTSYFGYKGAGYWILTNSGKIVFQGENGDLLIPSPTILKVQGAEQLALREIASGSSYTATANDNTIVWRSATASAKTQNILACSSTINGQSLTVKDGQGTAATYNITITPASGTIEGGATLVISTNRGAAQLECDGSATDWVKLN